MPKKGTKRSSSGIGNDLNESHSKRVRSSTKLLLEKPDLFKELLTEAGFNLPVDDDNSNTLNVDQAVFQKSLKRLLSKYDKEQVNNEFLGGLQTHIDNLERFRTSLLPTISSSSCQSIRCGNQESLIHLLLGVDSIQKQLVTILLEKLPELEEDDSNIGMLVLNQFRWLDKVVDSKMLVKKVFEILQVVSPNFQSHLILTLPEIIEDYQNEEVARYLQELLVENHQLAIPIIDALSNMQLDADQVQEAQNAAINILESASTDSLAVIVRFILLSVASNTEFNVISSLRSHLDLQFNMVPMISSTPARKLTEGNKKHENSDGFLILDTIHRVLRFNAVVANGFLKAIGDVDSADGHMVLDVYVILMLYSNVNYKKLVLTMLSNKIRNGLITIALLQTALISYPQVFKDHIGCIVSLAEYMIKCKDNSMCLFATNMLQLSFISLDMFCRQEVIGLLVSHVGSGVPEMSDTCLNILKNLVEENVESVEPFSAFIKGILDYIDNLSHHQIKQLFSILSILGFNEKQHTNLIQDDLHIFIRKQLSSDKEKYKKIGVIGAVEILNTLGSKREQDTPNDKQKGQRELSDEAFKQITGLMELVKKNCYSMPQVTALFYDELATIILKRQLNAKVQSWIDEEIANEFQDKYVTDIDVESVAQASEGFVSSGLFYSLEHEGSVAGIAIDIVKLTDSMVVPAAKSADLESPVCAVCLNPLFRLLKSCEEVRNGNLDDIDALLGCPVKTINIDNLQKPDKYSVKERKHICAYIFNTINWFREMLNAFSSHPDPELRLKVIERLENIIRLQDVLQSFLKFSPELKPPASEKNLEFLSTVKEVCIKVKAKPLSFQKQQKSNSQLKKDSSVTQCDESISQREEEKKTSKNMLTTNLLDHFKVYYRDLDITVFSVFSWAPISNSFGENSKEAKDDALEAKVSAEQVAFLLNDLYYKVNESLKPKQKLINLSKNLHNQNSHTHIPFVSENCMVDRVLDLTSVLCLHLENASAFYQALASDEEDLDDSYLPSSNSDHMEACYSLVLQVLIAVTSWSGFSNDANEELLESFFVHIYNRVHTTSEVKVTREQLLRESFVYLENFSNSVPNLNCAVLLVKLLISIENKANLADLRTKLGNLGKKFLQKKWSIVDCEMMSKRSELIQQLLRTYVTYSDDRFDCLSTITSTGMTELIESEGRQASQTYPLLTKQSFGCFFRNILCELVQGVKQISSTKDGTNDNAVCQWNAAIKVLQMLTKLIKMFTAKSNISALLKQGQKFIDVFLRSGMPILDKMFRLKKDDVLNMLKTLQHSTRMLHHICSHSKSVGDIALVAHVPPMKRSLESFVYRVKVMLTLHNCQDAFWIGNLKNRNIQGTEILSQRPASPSESESVDCGANSGDEEKSNSDDDNVDKTDDDESSKEDNKSDELICSDTEY